VGTIGNHGLPFWGNLLQKLTWWQISDKWNG
jgi:hypothetical protein